MKLKFWVPFALFVTLSVIFWNGLYRDPHKINSPLLNLPLPEFRASELDNPQLAITRADMTGQISLLNVFATWCLPCREENALLMNIANTHALKIVGLNYRDKRQTTQEWLKHYGKPYSQIIFDPNGSIAIELGVYGTPETFLIDKQGVIRYKQVGVLNEKAWLEVFLPLIEQLEHEP